jgi:hypothetical protein
MYCVLIEPCEIESTCVGGCSADVPDERGMSKKIGSRATGLISSSWGFGGELRAPGICHFTTRLLADKGGANGNDEYLSKALAGLHRYGKAVQQA